MALIAVDGYSSNGTLRTCANLSKSIDIDNIMCYYPDLCGIVLNLVISIKYIIGKNTGLALRNYSMIFISILRRINILLFLSNHIQQKRMVTDLMKRWWHALHYIIYTCVAIFRLGHSRKVATLVVVIRDVDGVA